MKPGVNRQNGVARNPAAPMGGNMFNGAPKAASDQSKPQQFGMDKSADKPKSSGRGNISNLGHYAHPPKSGKKK